MVLHPEEAPEQVIIPGSEIARNKVSAVLFNRENKKTYKINFKKGVVVKDEFWTVYPYGYCTEWLYIINISSVTSVIDMATVKDKERLKYLYTTPLQPSSFGGVNPLIEHSKLDKTVVQKWLPYQDTYTT